MRKLLDAQNSFVQHSSLQVAKTCIVLADRSRIGHVDFVFMTPGVGCL